MANRLSKLLIIFIRSGAIDIIVIDSVAALTPRAEIEGEMGDSKMGTTSKTYVSSLAKTYR
jgi:recombination protein RecA